MKRRKINNAIPHPYEPDDVPRTFIKDTRQQDDPGKQFWENAAVGALTGMANQYRYDYERCAREAAEHADWLLKEWEKRY